MRFLFYAGTLLNLHFEHPLYWHSLGFPERRRFSYLGGWATSHQLEDSFVDWCFLPKQLLNHGDGGLRSPLHDAVSAIVGTGTDCVHAWRVASIAVSVALALSAIGFLGRLPPLVAALGLLAQDGCFQMLRDSNHRLLVPSLCCLWLAINDYGQHAAWSLDKAIRRCVGPYLWPFGRGSLRETNGYRPVAASRMLCVATAATVFFSAGWSKVTQGHPPFEFSLDWALGDSLLVKLQGGEPGGRNAGLLSQLLKPLAREYGLVMILAASSLVMELSAPVAMCSNWARRILAVTWAGFHFGVLLLMYNVNYVPSMIVYLVLVIDWQGEDSLYQSSSRQVTNVFGDSFGLGIARLVVGVVLAAATCVLSPSSVLCTHFLMSLSALHVCHRCLTLLDIIC